MRHRTTGPWLRAALYACTATTLAASTAGAQWASTGSSSFACPQGLCDANWSVSWYGISALTAGVSGSLTHAALATSIPSAPWAPNISGVQQWIGASANATLGLNSGDSNNNYRYFFQTTFSLPTASTVSFGIGWDNRLVGAYQGPISINADGSYTPGIGALALLAATPDAPYAGGKFGFCRDGDGVYSSSQFPDCIVPVSMDVAGGHEQTLTFILQGDGQTDGLLAGGPNVSTQALATPEPTSLILFGSGIVGVFGIAARGRRRKPATKPEIEI